MKKMYLRFLVLSVLLLALQTASLRTLAAESSGKLQLNELTLSSSETSRSLTLEQLLKRRKQIANVQSQDVQTEDSADSPATLPNQPPAVSSDVQAPAPQDTPAALPNQPPAVSSDVQAPAPQDTPATAPSSDVSAPPAATSWEWGAPILSESREWTIMVYLDADNNLENAGMDDFIEMQRGFTDGGPSDVIVLVDRAKGFYDGLGDWTGTRAYRIKHSENKDAIASELIADLGELNLSSGDTLKAFISVAARKYPSKKTALVLWNHGMGWAGLASDNDTGSGEGASMTLDGLTQALAATTPELPDKKIDLLQFDMCLMGQAEVAAACAPYAQYMVAGAPIIPGVGMNYETYLPLFNAQRATDDIAKESVRVF